MAALPGFLNRLFDTNERDIARYRTIVTQINALEPKFEIMTDEELREQTQKLKERVQSDYNEKMGSDQESWEGLTDQQRREANRKIFDPILDEALPEAFALVREASKRTLGMRHYDVQMIGAIALHDGRIAEMRTGEGKTLVATCPLFLNALLGKGSHLVTANDYLSRRDAIWNGPVYHLLGMSVGIIQGQSSETNDQGGTYLFDPDYDDPDPREKYARPIPRPEAYQCDIIYGTNNEYGFDYLRDNMEFSKEEIRQRPLHYAIVDEVDSILIDEARTPLIISGMIQQPTDMYYQIDQVVAKMKKGIDDPKKDKDNPDADKHKKDIHYVVDEKQKTATITDAGVEYIERAMNINNLSENFELMHYLQASLKAHGVFRKDIDYVVKVSDPEEGPEIIIVDENTGRLMFGRRYSDGLHQAIEAKEKLKVKSESQTLATITFQNYFRLYSKLSGMTGTARTEEEEFRKIYGLDVVVVPTNKPMIRKDQQDVFYRNEEHKLRGITGEILRVYSKQQPLLVGTRSIEMSERVSSRISPGSLSVLCMIEVAREALEANKTISSELKQQYTNMINGPLLKLSISRLRPLLKELGLEDDPLSPNNMNSISKLFQIEDSGLERLEEALTHGIGHNILNAKYHEKEALIISEAGRKGSVTIATNMAGRGVDILLGGMHINQELPPVDGSLKSLNQAEKTAETAIAQEEATAVAEEEPSYRRYGKSSVLDAVTSGALSDEEHKKAASEVCSLGGLFILGTERHESRRIDNQLRGRSGRQGDPGESRFFISLEDELWRLFGERVNSPLLRTWEEHLSMEARILTRMIEHAQKKVEEHYFEARKHVLDYDDVMNRQRELIYRERRRILEGEDLRDTIVSYIQDNIEDAVMVFCSKEVTPAEWDMETLYNELNDYFLLYPSITQEQLHGKTREQIIELVNIHVMEAYDAREREIIELQNDPQAMRQLERFLALRAINDRWMEHLANMDYLKEGIGLRGYEQKDPLMIYQKEAFDEFERMQQSVQDDIIRNMFRIQLVVQPQQVQMPMIPLPQNLPKPKYTGITDIGPVSGGSLAKDNPPPDWKGGRNDPCWCGSGLKYKKCHGK